MTIPIAYNTALIAICVYVSVWGGKVGRWGVGMLLIATAFTYVGAKQAHAYSSLNWWVLTGDIGLLFGYIVLSVKGQRYWPLWASALHFNGVMSHFVALLAPVLVSKVYYAMATVWGVPVLLIMAVGTAMDRKGLRGERATNGGVHERAMDGPTTATHNSSASRAR
jgi:hypothetical protein